MSDKKRTSEEIRQKARNDLKWITALVKQLVKECINQASWIAPEPWHTKTSKKDGYGIWRHSDGRMDFNKYQFVDGHMVERLKEGVNTCVEDGMTHEQYVEHKYEEHAQRQRDKYGEADRDEEERRLNQHQTGREDII